MTDKFKKLQPETDLSSVFLGGGEAPDVVGSLKRDLEGWREILIPMAAFLRWEQPYHPAILLGSSTFLFALIWLCDISALTTISLVFLVLGILDFSVPYFGPSVTGYKTWRAEEEFQFTKICENIAQFKHELVDSWRGFVSMRQDNSKMFFILSMATLAFTAWIGNLVNNLLLTYLVVSLCLSLPGLQRNTTTRVYLQRIRNSMIKIQAILMKPKAQ